MQDQQTCCHGSIPCRNILHEMWNRNHRQHLATNNSYSRTATDKGTVHQKPMEERTLMLYAHIKISLSYKTHIQFQVKSFSVIFFPGISYHSFCLLKKRLKLNSGLPHLP